MILLDLSTVFNRTVVSLLPMVPRGLLWRFSRRYIAGTSLEDALRTVADLNQKGMSATLDVLGEDVVEAAAARRDGALYLEALDEIRRRRLDCNISVKLSQMGLRFDPALCRELVEGMARKAREQGNFVRIDMEDSSVTTTTLDLYRELRVQYPVGGVVQACLKRTPDDVAALLADGPTHLRLCKGIYIEPPQIALREREAVRNAFKSLLRQAFQGGIRKLAIATHDPPLIQDARGTIAALGIPRERYEFQMLLGVAEPLRTQLVAAGEPLRVYVPFGEAWHAYSVRRLRENPQIAGHVLRNLFS